MSPREAKYPAEVRLRELERHNQTQQAQAKTQALERAASDITRDVMKLFANGKLAYVHTAPRSFPSIRDKVDRLRVLSRKHRHLLWSE